MKEVQRVVFDPKGKQRKSACVGTKGTLPKRQILKGNKAQK